MRSLHFQRLLGSGAFGSVYLAELAADRGFRKQVAVKVLLKDQAHGDMFMARVRDEARLLGLLADDHILKVLELAKVEGRDAVMMEFVEGVDLNAIVEAGLRPPPRALAELGAAVAGALHRAHKAVHPSTGQPLNVIHRDVKPANVMVTSRGGVKLLDFGVARARFEARESYTGQFVLGTLNYMAPEYIVTGEVSPAADVYGLALTLWEAACGEVFGQPKLRQDLHKARVEERLEVIAGTHAELVPVLRQMLAWDAKARPDGAAVERAFIAAMDMLRGTGLRSWAGEAVPNVLARARETAKDEVGLLGRTVPIGDEEGLPAADSRVGVPTGPLPDAETALDTSRPRAADARLAEPRLAEPARAGLSDARSAAGAAAPPDPARSAALPPAPPRVEPARPEPARSEPRRGEPPRAERDPAEATSHKAPRAPFLEPTPPRDPRAADPRAADPRASGPRAADPRASGPRAADPRASGPRAADPRAEDAARGPRDARAADPRSSPPTRPGPPGASAAARRPPARRTSGNMLLLQGLLLGGALGFLLLVGIGALLLLRELL